MEGKKDNKKEAQQKAGSKPNLSKYNHRYFAVVHLYSTWVVSP